MSRAQILQHGYLILGTGNAYHLGAKRCRVLDSQVAETADADDGATLARPKLRIANAGINRESRAKHRRGVDRVHPHRHLLDRSRVHDHELGVAAVSGYAREAARRAMLISAEDAIAAYATPALRVGDANEIANRDIADIGSARDNPTYRL